MHSPTRKTIVGLLASAALFFGGVPAANAADCSVPSPTQDQYCPPSDFRNGGSDPSGLPFTGYDVGLAALAALALVGAGVGLRRAAKSEEAT